MVNAEERMPTHTVNGIVSLQDKKIWGNAVSVGIMEHVMTEVAKVGRHVEGALMMLVVRGIGTLD